MARPKTVQMQYIVLFSHRTVRLPSVVESHQQEAAVCNPAPAREGSKVGARASAASAMHRATVQVL